MITANLTVGNDVGMSGSTVCAAESATIGDNCLQGANTFVADTDFHPTQAADRRWRKEGVRTAPVHIGRKRVHGANALVPKGVSIGEAAVVGARSVVVSDVVPNIVVAGSPHASLGRALTGERMTKRASLSWSQSTRGRTPRALLGIARAGTSHRPLWAGAALTHRRLAKRTS